MIPLHAPKPTVIFENWFPTYSAVKVLPVYAAYQNYHEIIYNCKSLFYSCGYVSIEYDGLRKESDLFYGFCMDSSLVYRPPLAMV